MATNDTVTDNQSARIRQEALNEGLERLSGYRYFDGIGFACHGPMAAEALSTLGYDHLLPGWTETYKQSNPPIDAPPANRPIELWDRTIWKPALGAISRVSDWEAAFRDLFEDEPWQSVLGRWVPALFPGYAGGLTHGLIRVAHAVRAMPSDMPPSRLQLDELARGLAMWASVYTVLPGRPDLHGQLALIDALAALPRPEPAWNPIEAGTFARLHELTGFLPAVEAIAPPETPEGALSDLTETFCGVILDHPDVFAIPLVHAVTSVAATRTLLRFLPNFSTDTVYSQLWHVNAAIVAGFTPPAAADVTRAKAEVEPLTAIEISARAAEHGDAHVIKFVEATIRENAIRPSALYLRAAQQVLGRIPRP